MGCHSLIALTQGADQDFYGAGEWNRLRCGGEQNVCVALAVEVVFDLAVRVSLGNEFARQPHTLFWWCGVGGDPGLVLCGLVALDVGGVGDEGLEFGGEVGHAVAPLSWRIRHFPSLPSRGCRGRRSW